MLTSRWKMSATFTWETLGALPSGLCCVLAEGEGQGSAQGSRLQSPETWSGPLGQSTVGDPSAARAPWTPCGPAGPGCAPANQEPQGRPGCFCAAPPGGAGTRCGEGEGWRGPGSEPPPGRASPSCPAPSRAAAPAPWGLGGNWPQHPPPPRGLATHAGCQGPRWPRRSRPRGRAPSTWPVSAAAPGPARPAAGPPCAAPGTRRAAAVPPPGPGWPASGGPCLHRTEPPHAARLALPGRAPAAPTPRCSQRRAGEGFWLILRAPPTGPGGAASHVAPASPEHHPHPGHHPPGKGYPGRLETPWE